MFGKPEWFRAKRIGWGLVPVTWQGWIYAAVWACAIIAPFLMLVERRQGIEAIVWLVVSVSALCWDVREVLRKMSHRGASDAVAGEDDLLVSGKSERNGRRPWMRME